MKNLKKIALAILLFISVTACGVIEKQDEREYSRKDISENYSTEESERLPTNLSLVYYNQCKNEYKEIKSKFEWTIACENNNVKIDVTKDTDSDKIVEIDLETSADNQDDLVKEINYILKLNNMKEIDNNQFEKITNTNFTIIDELGFNKREKNSKIYIHIQKVR